MHHYKTLILMGWPQLSEHYQVTTLLITLKKKILQFSNYSIQE